MRHRVRAGALAAAALLAAGTVAGCDNAEDAAADGRSAPSVSAAQPSPGGEPQGTVPAALTGQKLDWKGCEAPVEALGSNAEKPGKQWQCATLEAPLDYKDPDGGTIGIALIRAKALQPERRIGSLLFNFGGPGGSGVATLPYAAEDYGNLNKRYDLVGFDPRGVARSSGVTCRDDAETEKSLAVDPTPDDAAEEKAYLADAADFGADCAERSGKLLPHVGTLDAARDMDLMRQVLGDRKLHYVGFSYGTELGGVYAHLFPRNVGRLVLDAVVDSTADEVAHARNQVLGFQRALENYFKSRGVGAEEGTARVVKLLKELDRQPLPTQDGRKLTEGLATIGIITPLYSHDDWKYLTIGLEAAERGDGSVLLALADSYHQRDSEGHYPGQNESHAAITCADTAVEKPTAGEQARHVADFSRISPVFGPALAWGLSAGCADWPVKGAATTPDVSAKGAAPILVIGTTGDPATPYEGARKTADELGKGVGVLVTNKGEGHGAYGNGTCVTEVVNAYLLEGTVPEDGTTCSS
ncbi:alpha/beta hydrolase [Streptomyces peucetius]|uniref:Alpha/beta hydrolase n=1 Tax=Streptomyces peucetius TaxID=1950 RepID=A0ABY6IDJ4_STRPE|nr:alpha/beta hydrolase [Streptomyces peucetius]UYQ64260.1 alpha/beta hydrolase [Streptomyces peucetius]